MNLDHSDEAVNVGISIVVTFTVTLPLGLLVGMMIMYHIMRRKKQTTEEQFSQDSTALSTQVVPIYEEVSSPKEEIQLKTNEAYGP